MRLIDADALFAEFENVGWYNNVDRDEVAERLVLQAPTIDAVEVVRCKDCRHQEHCHETVAHTKRHDGCIEYWLETIKWCSRGEREGE